MTIAGLSTPFAGFSVPDPLGGICRRTTEPFDKLRRKNTHRRFCRWRDRGVWAAPLEAVMDDLDFEWLMIDASYIKAHPHSAGAGAEISASPAQKGTKGG